MPNTEHFALLLQGGVKVEVETGCTVREFICEHMNICGDYAEKRIQTLFLDGKPVDDFDDNVVHDGSTLALSAAMPGLVGATMRRGGFYAKFRHGISYEKDGKQDLVKLGLVTVKLFNFTGPELADIFMQHGVYVEAERFHFFLSRVSKAFFDEISALHVGDQALSDPHALAQSVPGDGMLHVVVQKGERQ